MHIWGHIVLHPMSVPIADQFMFYLFMGCRYTTVVYVAVLKPTLEDLKFLLDHVE